MSLGKIALRWLSSPKFAAKGSGARRAPAFPRAVGRGLSTRVLTSGAVLACLVAALGASRAWTDGRLSGPQAAPGVLQAPGDNTKPSLQNPGVKCQRTGTVRGGLGDLFDFTVVYSDPEGDPPAVDGNGVPQVELWLDGKTRFLMGRDSVAPDYRAGVTYLVTLSGREIGAGGHTFVVKARDAAGLAADDAAGSGPWVDTPVLSDPSVGADQGIAGAGGAPFTGYPKSKFVFRVRYRHAGGVPAAYVRVHLLNPTAPGETYSEYRQLALSREPGQSDADIAGAGIIYSNAQADGVSPGPFDGYQAPGTYAYYFEASDGQSVQRLDDGGTPFTGPVIAAPALTPQGLVPARGVAAQPFVFRVVYAHPAGVPAASVKLRLLGPRGEPVALPNGGEMAAPTQASQIDSNQPPTWWVYTLGESADQRVYLNEPGTYRYSFVATDGATTVETPLAEGPVVVAVDSPVVSDPSAKRLPAKPGETPLATYRVTYRQSQNLEPRIWVYVDGAATAAGELQKENAADTNFADGAVYTVTVPAPDAESPHTYRFLVQVGGLAMWYPEAGALPGPNVPPVLERVGSATVAPAEGHTGTQFVFRVKCRDVDATADPRVYVLVGNQQLEMQKVAGSGNVQVEGAEYALQTTLPAGQLVHSFLATDGIDTVRYPDGQGFAGPTVLAATALNVSVTPQRLTLDGQTPISVSGSLAPVVPSAEVVITFQPPVGDAIVERVTASATGRFAHTLVPTRSGAWSVRVSYAGQPGEIGGGDEGPFAVQVDAPTFDVPGGLAMIGLPVVPDSADLVPILGAGVKLARWNGSGYDYSSNGTLESLRPGIGVWAQSPSPRQAVGLGRVVPHNQAVSVPVRRGWNQVANPYLAPVSWAALSFQPVNGVAMPLAQAAQSGTRVASDYGWAYQNGQYVLVHASVPGAARYVEAWQGFWFKANVDGQLIFAPPATRQATVAEETRERGNANGWSIQLVASNGEQTDRFNFAGVGAEGRSLADMENPPVLSDYVDLYFTGADGSRRLAADYRDAAAGGMAWDVVVDTDVTDRPVTVKAPNLASVPKDLEVVLEDVDAGGKRTYLRTAGGYTFNPGRDGRRHLRLIVRGRSEAPLRVSDVEVSPARGGRVISCAVSRDALLTVEIASPSGKRVKLVSDRQAAAQGRVSVLWDGTRDDGARLPAGVYLVQVTATTPEGQSARTIKPIVVVRW